MIRRLIDFSLCLIVLVARFVTGRGFVRSRGFIARELNVGSALCIFYGDGRTTIYDDNIWNAHSRTVHVGLAQARPKYMERDSE